MSSKKSRRIDTELKQKPGPKEGGKRFVIRRKEKFDLKGVELFADTVDQTFLLSVVMKIKPVLELIPDELVSSFTFFYTITAPSNIIYSISIVARRGETLETWLFHTICREFKKV